jgi:hypothetical protein
VGYREQITTDLAGAGDHGRIESREAIEVPAMHHASLVCFLI